LGFLAGDGRNPFMANMTWAHKMRVMRAIERLPARYVLVDLGAGSSYNTLDFFSLAPRGLVVSTPELPAIMNLMAFFKNWILRNIAREVNRNEPLKKIVLGARNQPMRAPAWTVEDLISRISDVSPEYGERIRGLCRGFQPRLVFNMVEHPDELELLKNVEQSLKKRLSLDVDFFGCLFRDPVARRVAGSGRPLLPSSTESVLAEGIVRLADRLIRLWASPISDSRLRLVRSTEKEYRGRCAAAGVNDSEPASGR
ncbi:MAG: MinD/ParA family protein, partial [Desulfuromonadales bacterium]|nr:MinD/ParA family protein [Desulfuromonadales bacterium]NIR34392.1 MinD/ParA family protein [Desulfuromonadales bacterium]NIS44362.1 MinD/ParA family protein [Desulfuromonadales bacterium]